MGSSRGDWFVTVSGRQVHVLDPDPELLVIEDIAHALAHTCRFGGHVRRFYSVAEHSVLVSRLVPDEALAFDGLMHDAAEAYLGDVIRPLKLELPEYKAIEHRWEAAIAERFGLRDPMPPEVKHADRVALQTERHALVADSIWQWTEDELGIQPEDTKQIRCLSPEEARAWFLARFEELHGR